jgi:endonuclease/exonuclease/phosphatase family metal-dependent hydrolase
MKIATWNLERPTNQSLRLTNIQDILISLEADIIILTETNKFIDLGSEYYSFNSSGFSNPMYKEGELRSSIYSKYPSFAKIKTFNEETSICEVLDTPIGNIAVYATIIGIYGNRHPNFKTDLELQLQDFKSIGTQYPICLAGDFNISFIDNYYYTKEGRDKLNKSFNELGLINLTDKVQNNIDHIVISQELLSVSEVNCHVWNLDKNLSDHIGVMVDLI